jgi:5-methylcytosine-specific restriction endonuclease McrA
MAACHLTHITAGVNDFAPESVAQVLDRAGDGSLIVKRRRYRLNPIQRAQRREMFERDPHCHLCGCRVALGGAGGLPRGDRAAAGVLACETCFPRAKILAEQAREAQPRKQRSKNSWMDEADRLDSEGRRRVREQLLAIRPTCAYCGCNLRPRGRRKRAQLEHIIPGSRGGRDVPRNLTLACDRCNTFKGDRTPLELLRWALRVCWTAASLWVMPLVSFRDLQGGAA